MGFSDSQREAIVNYKYHGVDKSLLYQNVLSPLAQSLVDSFIPHSMAPNVITSLGLLCSLVSLVLTLVHDPTLEGKAPSWVYYSTAASVLAYQTLDNMDGKQARKTGSASALGMYYDHVCDAINAALTSISMASVLAVGWTPKLFFFVSTGFVPFYVQTWEEYYTNSLVLPIINGPNEGLVLIAIFASLAGYFGGTWFQQETDFLHNDLTFLIADRKLRPFDFVFILGYLMAVTTIFTQLITVCKVVASRRQSIWRPLADLTPILFYTWGALYWVLYSDTLQRQPLLTWSILSLVHVELVSNLLLAQISKCDIRPNDRLLVWTMMMLPLNTWMGDTLCDPSNLTYAVFLIALVYDVLFIVESVGGLANVLGIFVFKLGRA